MGKKDIPNIITTARIILSPIIIPVIWSGQIGLGIGLFVVTALTDAFDGFLARKWNVQSIEGKYLDTIADKEFALITLISAMSLNPGLIASLVLELAIAGVNLKSFTKKYPTKSSQTGRIKTGFLSVTIGLSIFNQYINNLSALLDILLPVLTVTTIGLQASALKNYVIDYKKNNKNKEAIVEDEKINKSQEISDQDVSEHMKNFTFYNKSFEKSKAIKKLYRDYLIPAKMENNNFNNNRIENNMINEQLKIEHDKVKIKK